MFRDISYWQQRFIDKRKNVREMSIIIIIINVKGSHASASSTNGGNVPGARSYVFTSVVSRYETLSIRLYMI